MAAILPTDVFAGYELIDAGDPVTADSIVIPLTALPELTAGEANETTGDGAQLIRAIDKAAHAALTALPTIERPTNMTFGFNQTPNGPNARTATYSRSYNEEAPEQTFDLAADA